MTYWAQWRRRDRRAKRKQGRYVQMTNYGQFVVINNLQITPLTTPLFIDYTLAQLLSDRTQGQDGLRSSTRRTRSVSGMIVCSPRTGVPSPLRLLTPCN